MPAIPLRALANRRLLGIATTTIVVCVAFTAFAYSPKYLEKTRKDCTFAGKVNEGCVEYFTEVLVGPNPLGIKNDLSDTLEQCFHDATSCAEHHCYGDAAALALFARHEKQDPETDNKYVTACIDATVAAHDDDWLQLAKFQRFLGDLAYVVNGHFVSKCGARAQLSSGAPPTILLLDKPTKRGNFYQGNDGTGGTMTIACTGLITGKTGAGKPYHIAPQMMATVMAAARKSCVAGCEEHDKYACDPSTSMDHSTCVPDCNKQCE